MFENEAADDLIGRLKGVRDDLDGFGLALITHLARTIAGAGDVHKFQHLAHGLAWYSTLIRAFSETVNWVSDARRDGRLSASGRLAGLILCGELLAECRGGVAMHQLEIIRPQEFGLPPDALAVFANPDIESLIEFAGSGQARDRLILLLQQEAGADLPGFELDSDAIAMADEVRRYSQTEILPHAHQWHVRNDYVPASVIAGLAELGVFGIGLPELFGGAGASKIAMCAITEELSRAYIGTGSLGTRSEIAAELILKSGRDAQQEHYLPRIASGAILPAAAFTEPEAGSDLGAVRCRADRDGDDYVINGSKIWITHAARADLLTLLVRTDSQAPGYRGLSMLLVDKPRGSDGEPFPLQGMSGSEIEVIGYRGMKEYEIGFQNFRVPASALLGNDEGQGFRQLMQTFETARIQTAARATGVARAAVDHALAYAGERRQFGKALIEFPRVRNKIVKAYAEVLGSRLLTLAAARAKDAGRRCDLEAGMAKLYAARAAWAAADGAVQVFGGNGFAVASPVSRILCDARILSIFEGAAEIQAEIIARRLLQ